MTLDKSIKRRIKTILESQASKPPALEDLIQIIVDNTTKEEKKQIFSEKYKLRELIPSSALGNLSEKDGMLNIFEYIQQEKNYKQFPAEIRNKK